jgi:hypothetical protein
MKPTQEQVIEWAIEAEFVESDPAQDEFSAIWVCCPRDMERLVMFAYKAGRKDESEWQGLTDEEILADDVLRYHFALNGGAGPISKKGRAIIAAVNDKLREKNT